MRIVINPAGIADFFEYRIRLARQTRRNVRLQRELSRLPSYVTRDLGLGPDQNPFVNFVDD
jgi:hypothetical protein